MAATPVVVLSEIQRDTLRLLADTFVPSVEREDDPERDGQNLPGYRMQRTSNNTLQKLTYAIVLFVFFPLMILTGLAMSPGGDALLPFLPDLLGGRQTARTIHFVVMSLLVAFFVVHIVMILAAGPINELRSIVTGWYRTDPPHNGTPAPATTEQGA